MCLHIWRGSVCKVLFFIPFVSHYIVSLSPVIKSSIMWMNHNLFYYYVPLGYLGCFKFLLINNAGYLFVNEYLIVYFLSERPRNMITE